MHQNWNAINGLETVASPGLLVNADGLARNIRSMLAIVGGDADRLRPHVKTHKMPAVIQQQLAAGIRKFKSATLSEAEMVASVGGRDVLLAYPIVGANLARLRRLLKKHPDCNFGVVVDDEVAMTELADSLDAGEPPLATFIDVDCGMHRTGIEWGESLDRLRQRIVERSELKFAGLHVYDGHLHQPDLGERRAAVESILESLQRNTSSWEPAEFVVGGSPTFALWAEHSNITCSPGTSVFWDIGYGTNFPDLPFEISAALLTRVISKPGANRICLDLGYKAIAAEMPLPHRVEIPAIQDARLIGQSEEHLVVETNDAASIKIGDSFIAFPRHICPTVALHDFATVIRQSTCGDETWPVVARSR